MTTATNITIPCTPTTLTAMIQQWKASITDTPVAPATAARPMSASEIAAFLIAASHDSDKISGLLIACTLLSGIPPLELAAAEWDLNDADVGTIEVCDAEAGYYASYQLSRPALEMLKAMDLRRHNVPLVFHQNGEPMDINDLADAFERISLNAGIMNLSVADLMMAYDHLVLFAALFEIPLTLPEGCDAHTCDAEDDRLPLVDEQAE